MNTLSQLKEATRASTGCGSCTGLCQDLLRAVAPEFEEEVKKVICGCLPFAEDRLREILRSDAAQVGAGGARDLRQRPRLRSVQAGAELHARHALVRRPRRGSLGALHQRSRARQHSEGRNVLGDPAHPRRRDERRRAAPHRRRGGQVPRADGEDHRQPAHRPARREEGRPAEDLGRPRHAVGPGLHQGRAHGEDLRRHRLLPVRDAGLHRGGHRARAALRAAVHAAQGEDGRRRLPAQLRRGHGEGHRARGTGRRLAGGRRRRGRQVRAQGRSARRRSRPRRPRSRRPSSSSSTTARTRTISSGPTTSSSGSASRKCGRRPSTRSRPSNRDCAIDSPVPRLAPSDPWLEGREPRHPTQFIPLQPLEKVLA